MWLWHCLAVLKYLNPVHHLLEKRRKCTVIDREGTVLYLPPFSVWLWTIFTTGGWHTYQIMTIHKKQDICRMLRLTCNMKHEDNDLHCSTFHEQVGVFQITQLVHDIGDFHEFQRFISLFTKLFFWQMALKHNKITTY